MINRVIIISERAFSEHGYFDSYRDGLRSWSAAAATIVTTFLTATLATLESATSERRRDDTRHEKEEPCSRNQRIKCHSRGLKNYKEKEFKKKIDKQSYNSKSNYIIA